MILRSLIAAPSMGRTYCRYPAVEDALHGQRPGVLVVHGWTGVGDYVKARA